MKDSISAAMLAHLALEVTTLATCWKITRADATIMYFTDHTSDIPYSGQVYLSASGYSTSPIKSTSSMAVDNLDIFCLLDDAAITASDLSGGIYDFALVEMFAVNYNDLTMGHINLKKGHIGQVSTAGDIFTAEMRGMSQVLQQTVGEIYSRNCRADLGDSRCAVNLASFTVTGTLTGATDRANFADSSRTEADDYFRGGKITWTGGANNGLSMEVKSYTLSTGAIVLQQDMPFVIAIGDTYSMYAGCDKSVAICRTTFSNVVNFRGEPHVPGQDELFKVGGQ